jgi:PAS domain S-box-containing protein
MAAPISANSTEVFQDALDAKPNRARVEEIVREGEEWFRQIADTAPVLIRMSGVDKHCTYFNKPWLDFTGRPIEEKLGNGWADGVHADDFQRCLDTYTQSFDRREKFRMEYRLRRYDGEYRWILDVGIPRFNQDRSFAGYIGVGVDVTERKLTEQELVRANERLHLAIDAGSAGGWDFDLATGKNTWFGKTHAQLGMTHDETLGSRTEFWDRVHEDDRERVEHALQVAKEKREDFAEEFRVVWRDGTTHWLRSRGRYYYAATGEPERMLGISMDITESKTAQEALSRYAAIIESSNDGICSVTLDGVTATWNEGAQRMFGYTANETVGRPASIIVPPELRDQQKTILETLRAGGRIDQFETVRVSKTGKRIDVSLSISPVKDSTGKIVGCAGIARDITNRKRAEEALQSSERRYRLLFERSVAGVGIASLDGRLLDCNDGWARILGYDSRDEVLGHHASEFYFNPAERQPLVDELFGKQVLFSRDLRLRRKDGTPVWVLFNAAVLSDQDRPMVQATMIDISEWKTSEEALHASEERLRLAQQAAHMGTFDWNLKSGVLTWTAEMEVLYGLCPGSFAGTREAYFALVHPEDRERVRTLSASAMQSGQPMQGEWRIVWPDGSIHWISAQWRVLMNEQGEPARVIGVNSDITERKQAEENLRRSEERFRLAAQAAKISAYEWNVLTDAVLRSAGSTPLLEHDEPREITGQQEASRIHPDDREDVSAVVAALSPENPLYHVSYRYTRPSGNVTFQESHGIAHFDDSGKLLRIIGMVADITERKLAEESQARLAAIVESSEDAIISKTLEGIITSWNSGAQRVFGYTSEEAIGCPITTIIPPELRDEERTILSKLQSGERIEHFETVRVTKAGKKIDVSLSISPIRDAAGKIVGASKIARDITERKSAERELMDVRRRLANAHEEERARIGRELHDDINQRLAMVSIEIDKLQIQFPKSAAGRNRRLEDLKERLIDTANGVQSLSHQLHPAQLQYLGIVGAMKGFCRDFSERQRVNVGFTAEHVPKETSYDVSLCLFRVLQEAIHNTSKHGHADQIKVNLSSSSNELELTISDNGKGFDPNEAALKGKGLGLSSMRERVRLVNGTISIESKPLGGTTIHVRVPLGPDESCNT